MMSDTTKPDSWQPAAEMTVGLFDNLFDPIESEVRARAREFIEEICAMRLCAAAATCRAASRAGGDVPPVACVGGQLVIGFGGFCGEFAERSQSGRDPDFTYHVGTRAGLAAKRGTLAARAGFARSAAMRRSSPISTGTTRHFPLRANRLTLTGRAGTVSRTAPGARDRDNAGAPT